MAKTRTDTRTETDTFGPVEIPADRWWGAQSERSRQNFRIGQERMPKAIIRALGLIKAAAADVNCALGLLDKKPAQAIATAAREVAEGKLDEHFPLVVWQTGSGTQTNMNVNEVVAARANQMLGGKQAPNRPCTRTITSTWASRRTTAFPPPCISPRLEEATHRLLPALAHLQEALESKSRQFAPIVKIGRTHLQDATPLTLGQEFSGYAAQVEHGRIRLQTALNELYPLAQGGTAVGTGLNAHRDFGKLIAKKIAELTGLPFVTAANKFEALASHDALVFVHGALTALAAGLFKIANDIRLLGSGPRSGFGELIVAGKRARLLDHARQGQSDAIGGADDGVLPGVRQSHHDLNRSEPRPFRAQRLQTGDRLRDAAVHSAACGRHVSFTDHCVSGIEANEPRIRNCWKNR